MDTESLLNFDHTHVWHPYAPLPPRVPVYPVRSAQGVRLTLGDGRELIDGMSSWWAAIHGYNHPRLNEALTQQLGSMAHVMFGGLTHEPAVKLAKKLIAIAPKPLEKVFFADSGSVSVEVAIKMALQYWISAGKKGKARLLSLRNGYHGDTFGAMAVCDPHNGMHHLFSAILPQHLFAPPPPAGYDTEPPADALDKITALIELHHQSLAAVILEPIVQGAGGMRIYSPRYLRHVRELCTHYNVLLIADEIATGFGRTGELFGCNHATISPDIMCVGKALTGGYMTLAAVLTTPMVSDTISSGEMPVLMHGPTFMANALACAVACASLELLLDSPWQQRVKQIEKGLNEGLAELRGHPHVSDIRVLGAIGVVELSRAVNMRAITEALVHQGVWLRPFGKLLYTMPPFIINQADLSTITRAMVTVAHDSDSLS
jgi:adenosylmethionine-8-amino-7-oxononanoate aminotransferase